MDYKKKKKKLWNSDFLKTQSLSSDLMLEEQAAFPPTILEKDKEQKNDLTSPAHMHRLVLRQNGGILLQGRE